MNNEISLAGAAAFLPPTDGENGGKNAAAPCSAPSAIQRDFSTHPCFSKAAHHKHARVHLPVAPRCNLQCNFCNRKFDCMNESRPGVTSAVLTPVQAVAYLEEITASVPNLSVVGIAGPGDPFANPVETMQTLELVRERFPKLMLCLASNGLGIASYIDRLAELEVSHVTLTINAVDPAIGEKVYAWIRDGHRPMRGLAAAALLLERQLDAIRHLKERNVVVKINSIVIPGINDAHIPEVAKVVGPMGVDLMNCMAFLPVTGAAFEEILPPDSLMVARARMQSGQHVPQMTHCARCRADAVGLIHDQMDEEKLARLNRFAHGGVLTGRSRPYVAVASQEGALVNQHLGEAARVLIFRKDDATASGFKFHEVRKAPEPGAGDGRWHDFAALLHDCRAFLVNAAGPKPKRLLEDHGIEVIEMEGLIEEGLTAVFTDQPLPASLKRRFQGCSSGAGCKGTGTGCG